MFATLKKLFNQKSILFEHFSNLYGKRFKQLIYRFSTNKVLFGKRFFWVLSLLEQRLSILLLRLRFCSRLLESTSLVESGFIHINGICSRSNILVSVLDIIQYKPVRFFSFRSVRYSWREFRWNKWISFSKKKGFKRNWVQLYFRSKVFTTVNFLEINYKILAGCLLRKPVFGEVLIGSSRRKLNQLLFKKIYFLY